MLKECFEVVAAPQIEVVALHAQSQSRVAGDAMANLRANSAYISDCKIVSALDVDKRGRVAFDDSSPPGQPRSALTTACDPLSGVTSPSAYGDSSNPTCASPAIEKDGAMHHAASAIFLICVVSD